MGHALSWDTLAGRRTMSSVSVTVGRPPVNAALDSLSSKRAVERNQTFAYRCVFSAEHHWTVLVERKQCKIGKHESRGRPRHLCAVARAARAAVSLSRC